MIGRMFCIARRCEPSSSRRIGFGDWIGGKAAIHQSQGFRFDMGPTILTIPNVLKRIYEEANRPIVPRTSPADTPILKSPKVPLTSIGVARLRNCGTLATGLRRRFIFSS